MKRKWITIQAAAVCLLLCGTAAGLTGCGKKSGIEEIPTQQSSDEKKDSDGEATVTPEASPTEAEARVTEPAEPEVLITNPAEPPETEYTPNEFPPQVNPEPGVAAVYQNPVFNQPFADPAAIRAEDGTIYAYATQDDWDDGITHLNAIIKSTDLIHWEYVGEVFETVPEWNSGTAIWATDIIKVGERYVYYYTLIDKNESNPAIGAAVSDSPAGPFEDMGKVTDARAMGIYAIDPFPIYDEDGSLYLILGNYDQGSYIVPLSEDGLSVTGAKEPIGAGFEGNYIIKRGKYYYLFGSLGTVWEGENSTYHVCVARSEKLKGPYYTKSGEILSEQNKDLDENIILMPGASEDGGRFLGGPGNNSFIRDDNGVDWMLYHAVDSEHPYMENGGTRRPLCIDPLVWDEAGWPQIADRTPSVTGYAEPYFEMKQRDTE